MAYIYLRSGLGAVVEVVYTLHRSYLRETPRGCLDEDSKPREVVPTLDSIPSDVARGVTNECVRRVN